MQQAQQFKVMVEQVKQQSLAAKDQAVHNMKTQMERVGPLYVNSRKFGFYGILSQHNLSKVCFKPFQH